MDVIDNLQDGSPHTRTLWSASKDLLGWGNKPEYLIPMAYRWCSAISKKIRERWGDEPTSEELPCYHYGTILFLSLAIAFRHIGSKRVFLRDRLSRTPHDEWMFHIIFTRGDDDAIADALYVGIVDDKATPSGSCTRRLLKLTERGRPFSPRLRWTILHFVQERGCYELGDAELEFVCLLNNLEVSVGEAGDAGEAWVSLFIRVLFTPMGQGRLSPHYWLLLGNFVSVFPARYITYDGHIEVMESLEEAQDWGKLETWMLVVWWSRYCYRPVPIQDIERATLTLFRQRPSAIPKFEGLLGDHTEYDSRPLFDVHEDVFRRACDQGQVEQSRLW
jgi:hypothetical protein